MAVFRNYSANGDLEIPVETRGPVIPSYDPAPVETRGPTLADEAVSFFDSFIPTVDESPVNPTPYVPPSYYPSGNSPTPAIDPAYSSEFNRVHAAGDPRSFTEWLTDHVNLTNDSNPGAREYLGLPAVTDLGSLTPPPLPDVVTQFFDTPSSDQPAGGGILDQFSNLINSILGGQRPNVSTTIAPISQTDNSVNISGLAGNMLDDFIGRITSLVSVPRGGDTMLPNLLPLGYAPNPAQSTQRQGAATVSTISGLPGVTGSAATTRWSLYIGLALVLLTGYLVWLQVKKK